MDRRSWPWKKKSSEKDDPKSVKYVQITLESYNQLSGLEDQVKTLNENLLSAKSEIIVKDNLVKQHAKVAEEAVSGWEKAEAEALALKQQLESVTLLKLAAEERSSHLDGDINECMEQLRNVKEESENKLNEVVFTRTKQWEIVKADLEAKVNDFEQELLKAFADNSILSRSLQERSTLLMKITEEKSQVDAQIEVLKNNKQLCEREISSMKYELHVVTKELEIRNEEKNMSMRSAEVANKQHLEGVKKIAKLEAECQRLRSLVRKRLPGPAALAQMKIEVENFGRNYVETRLGKSAAKGSCSHHASEHDCTPENTQEVRKENEFLAARLLEMEEEMKIVKETLSNSLHELQDTRTVCIKQASEFRRMEAHRLLLNQHESRPKFSKAFHFENESDPPSSTSMSGDGIDEEMSYSDSQATALNSEILHCNKDSDVNEKKAGKLHNFELLDDFLEMERLACQSIEDCKDMTRSDVKRGKDVTLPLDYCVTEGDAKRRRSVDPKLLLNSTVELTSMEDTPFLKLRDSREELPQHCFVREGNEVTKQISSQSHFQEDDHEIIDIETPSRNNGSPAKLNNISDQDLKDAISYVREFLVTLCKGDAEVQSNRSTGIVGISKNIEEFSAYIDRIICNKINLRDFVLDLVHIFIEVTNLESQMGTSNVNERGCDVAEFFEKETLLENKITQHEKLSRGSSLVIHSSSSAEIEGSFGAGFRIKYMSPAFPLGDIENLKMEKEKAEVDLARCKEMLDHTKSTLVEVELQLSELRSELAFCQKSNSLAETQLKCMAESYKLLESRKEELEAEVHHFHAKAETLDYELQVERHAHQEDIVKYNELQVQIERYMKCSTISVPSDTDSTRTQQQEREIAVAVEKLAECQETMILLGRQLNAIQNPAEQAGSSPCNNNSQLIHDVLKDERNAGRLRLQSLFSPLHPGSAVPENPFTPEAEQSHREPPLVGHSSQMSPSDTGQTLFRKSPLPSKHQKACSSSSPSSPSNEKLGRGFRRIFSRGKLHSMLETT